MFKIAVIGSPGSGKTTLSTGIFYHLKTIGEHAEMVPELIKYKVYKNLAFNLDGFDVQNTLEQREFEHSFDNEHARKQIDFLICEAPLCNGYFYSSFYEKTLESPILKKIAADNINNYDLIFFVERVAQDEYVTFGRKESQEQAMKLELHIKQKIKELGFANKMIQVTQATSIFEVLKHLGISEEKLELLKQRGY